MKKTLAIIAAFLTLNAAAFGQDIKTLSQRQEVITVEDDDEIKLQVFTFPKDGETQYYLSVGNLGIGDEVLHVYFDPVHELFIPLGNNLSDALVKLIEFRDLCKKPAGTGFETQGCLAFGIPSGDMETVKVTARRLIFSRMAEFSVEREGYTRATYVDRSDLASAVINIKLHMKMHPEEQ